MSVQNLINDFILEKTQEAPSEEKINAIVSNYGDNTDALINDLFMEFKGEAPAPEQLNQIKTGILEIKNDIERIAERQEEMVRDMRDVKTAIYNPDSGLYARLRVLEVWKESQSKIQWGVIMAIVGLVTTTLYKMIIES